MIINGKKLNKILKDHSTWILTKGRSGKMADLNGKNLDGANLEMANLPFANLQSSSLKGAYLQGSNFRGAKLNQINLCGARLDGADFEGADLTGADLSFAVCNGTSFIDANLSGSNFIKAVLSDVDFTGSNMHGANFRNASIAYSDMNNANFKNVNFEGAHIGEADYNGQFFSYPKENELKLFETDFTYQDLTNLIADSSIDIRTKQEDLKMDAIAIDRSIVEEALRELMDKIKSNINEDQVEKICKEQYGIEKINSIDFERGDVVVQNEQVSFKLNYLISCSLTLLIDRNGNCTVASSSDRLMAPDMGTISDAATDHQ